MRRTVRLHSEVGPEERLARALAGLPRTAVRALWEVAERTDLPLVAGLWEDGSGGCLVANVVRVMAAEDPAAPATLDLRILELLPELSSRDLNRLIVAWDEAAEQEGRCADAALRRLLRNALVRAGAGAPDWPGYGRGESSSTSSVTSTSSSSAPRTSARVTVSPGA